MSTSQTQDLTVLNMSLLPIKDHKSYEFYCRQKTGVWSHTELDYSTNIDQYQKLDEKCKRMIDIILAFFLPGDGLVNNNIIHQFLTECKTAEETMMYIAQIDNEITHALTYSFIIDSIYDETELIRIHNIAMTSPYMKLKFDFMEKWSNKDKPESSRKLAWACTEGIFFSVLFAVIFWFRTRNTMINITHANELIAKDETLHRDYGCHLYLKCGGLPESEAYIIVSEAVNIEDQFITWLVDECITDENTDLTSENLKLYVRLVADNLLVQCKHRRLYLTNNPFPWMSDISLVQKNNFYEVRGASYSRASITDVLNMTNAKVKKDDIYDNLDEHDF